MGVLVDFITPMFLFAAGVAMVAGLVRGFSGFGAGMIMAPCFSVAFGPVIAVPLIQIMDSAIQFHVVPPVFKKINWRQQLPMIASAIILMPLGVKLLLYIDQDTMRVSISILVLLFVVLIATGWRYRGAPKLSTALFTGGVSGLLSGSASMGGPPVVFFNLLKESSADDARAGIIGFFSVTSVAALLLFWVNGAIDGSLLLYGLVLTPIYSLGTLIGSKLFNFSEERVFRIIALLIVTIAAIIGIYG